MIRLSREVRASIGQPDPPGPIRNAWAGWPAAEVFSPFVVARVTVRGIPDPVSGYLCDIKVLDDWIRQGVLPVLASTRSLPKALLQIGPALRDSAPHPTVWEQLELYASPYLRFSIHQEKLDMVRLTEQFEFSAAHRLHCPQWSDEKNRASFGKCNNPSGHGHNYIVDITIEGVPDSTTGMLLPAGQLEQIVNEQLIKRFDHKHLNIDITDFENLNPSVENIARVAWTLLEGKLAPARLTQVRVYETAKTWVDYEGDNKSSST
jgi:6-pyruvoyltetrahydropterin/6-carboxytetrahydropterin synthase